MPATPTVCRRAAQLLLESIDQGHLFFLVGAGLFGLLAVAFQRRCRQRWTAALGGMVGAALLLGGVLVVAPRILASLGLFPS